MTNLQIKPCLNTIRYLLFNGFSLIELLLVLSIISMLLTFGVNRYVDYIHRGSLLQAQSDLLMLGSRLEQYKLFNVSYFGAAGSQVTPENTGAPWIFQSYSPADKPEQKRLFNLSILYVSDSGLEYQIVATPIENKTVHTQKRPSFGRLIYYSDGRKGYDKNNDGEFSATEMCWDC
ncbi:prepilin-type N-terminal cleavage/methylation domain-containing protein [uncultured Psychrosphaera sp.]|uniref:type IV pilin protein n=1 Tax=uncultured Psychrosphaera sp. TaxID=1403522 RepID=UPI0030F4DDEA